MPHKNVSDRAEYMQRYYTQNRERILERLRNRSAEERAVVNERSREKYATDPRVRDLSRAAANRWRTDPANKTRIADRNKRYYASEKGRTMQRRKTLQKFNITVEQYDALFQAQGGLCAICRQPETARHRGRGRVIALAVDHNHNCCPERGYSCGKCIRGLLCDRCNFGRWPEDPAILRAAADYFEKYQEV
jgi:hypothetical protein